MYIILCFILLSCVSCASNRHIATVHTERIEERLKPVAVGADTIEIEYLTENNSLTECTELTENAVASPAENRIKNIKVASTRGVSVKTTHTDSTQTLRITLKPDTIFVPYVHHIRSDTIIAPDPTIKAKLTTARWQIVALILIIIAIIIIFLILRQNNKKT
ncbi:MAG: hypothetical protein IKV26_04130 [Paludibacteraceae bacterium]|nr:hypothetical protein [Paludibacteraceae bacterium]